ncbi:ankyrin repeat protein [Cotonvirus japonicus]|uniref:Ankyrin repeat protein n=1 Tax=Cotonvirus japonicus TaxID=2811091 RepID=A0ABM7NRB1_9VIRU|nr:ankyrin repeat protein [Cotonvirus japonicus]BCS82690.1 ankyrin repeat protein [Cotonvirus japonicus]
MEYYIKDIEYYYEKNVIKLSTIDVYNCSLLYGYKKIKNIDDAVTKCNDDYITKKINKVSVHNLLDIVTYFVVTNNAHYFDYCIKNREINIDYSNYIFWRLAISNNSFDIIDYLLKLNIDINMDDNYAIIVAADNKSMKLFSFLTERGADISIKCIPRIFIRQESIEKLKFLVENNIDITSNHKNIILSASIKNDAIIKYFINLGCNVLLDNVFRAAVYCGNVNIVKLLLSIGADVNVLTNDDLKRILKYNFIKMIPILIDAGFNFNAINSQHHNEKFSEIINNMEVLDIDFKNLFKFLVTK